MSDSSQKTFRSPESKERYDKLLADLKLRLKEYDLTNLIVDKSEYPINTDGGFSDIYTARSLKHGGSKVAIKQLRGVRLGEKAIKASEVIPPYHPGAYRISGGLERDIQLGTVFT